MSSRSDDVSVWGHVKRVFVNGTLESQLAVLVILALTAVYSGSVAYHNPRTTIAVWLTISQSALTLVMAALIYATHR